MIITLSISLTILATDDGHPPKANVTLGKFPRIQLISETK